MFLGFIVFFTPSLCSYQAIQAHYHIRSPLSSSPSIEKIVRCRSSLFLAMEVDLQIV